MSFLIWQYLFIIIWLGYDSQSMYMMDSFNRYEFVVFWVGPRKRVKRSNLDSSIVHSLTANLDIADHCLTRLQTLWAPFLPPCPPSTMDCTLKSPNPSFLPKVTFLRYSVRSNSNNKTTKTWTSGYLVPDGDSVTYFQISLKWFCGELRGECVKSRQSPECGSQTWTKPCQGPQRPRPKIQQFPTKRPKGLLWMCDWPMHAKPRNCSFLLPNNGNLRLLPYRLAKHSVSLCCMEYTCRVSAVARQVHSNAVHSPPNLRFSLRVSVATPRQDSRTKEYSSLSLYTRTILCPRVKLDTLGIFSASPMGNEELLLWRTGTCSVPPSVSCGVCSPQHSLRQLMLLAAHANATLCLRRLLVHPSGPHSFHTLLSFSPILGASPFPPSPAGWLTSGRWQCPFWVSFPALRCRRLPPKKLWLAGCQFPIAGPQPAPLPHPASLLVLMRSGHFQLYYARSRSPCIRSRWLPP